MAICLTYSNYRVQKWYRNIWWFFREFEAWWFPIFSRGVCGVLPWRLLFPLWLIGPVQCGHWHIFYRGAPCTLHLIFYRAGTWYLLFGSWTLKNFFFHTRSGSVRSNHNDPESWNHNFNCDGSYGQYDCEYVAKPSEFTMDTGQAIDCQNHTDG